jgi:hypothetical protein
VEKLRPLGDYAEESIGAGLAFLSIVSRFGRSTRRRDARERLSKELRVS